MVMTWTTRNHGFQGYRSWSDFGGFDHLWVVTHKVTNAHKCVQSHPLVSMCITCVITIYTSEVVFVTQWPWSWLSHLGCRPNTWIHGFTRSWWTTHKVCNTVNMHAHDDYQRGNQSALIVQDDVMCVVPTEYHTFDHPITSWIHGIHVEDGYHRITVLAWLLRYVIIRVPLCIYVWITG